MMGMYAKLGSYDRVDELWDKLKANKDGLQPDVITCNHVLAARAETYAIGGLWARSKPAMDRLSLQSRYSEYVITSNQFVIV